MTRLLWVVAAALCICYSGTAGDNKGTVVTLDGLKSRTPANWKMQPAKSKMRAYQFDVPRIEDDKKDAEVIVFFFGTGSGGSVEDNLKRWKEMITSASFL